MKTTQKSTISKEPCLIFSPTSKDEKEKEKTNNLTPNEQAWLEDWELKHLAYSDIDLHY